MHAGETMHCKPCYNTVLTILNGQTHHKDFHILKAFQHEAEQVAPTNRLKEVHSFWQRWFNNKS